MRRTPLVLEVFDDFSHWAAIVTNTAPVDVWVLTDPEPPANRARRFYQSVVP